MAVVKRATFADLRGALSQKEVATKTGLSRELISRIEHGRVNPTADELERISKVLNASVETVVGALISQEPLWTRKTA